MRPYRLIFYFFKCYLDRVQYQDQFLLFYSNHSQGVLRSTHRQLLVGFRTTFV